MRELRLYWGTRSTSSGRGPQKDFKSLAGGRIVEESIEIKVRNHKAEPVEVQVYEHPSGAGVKWEIVSASGEWQKSGPIQRFRFPVKVGKDQEKWSSTPCATAGNPSPQFTLKALSTTFVFGAGRRSAGLER